MASNQRNQRKPTGRTMTVTLTIARIEATRDPRGAERRAAPKRAAGARRMGGKPRRRRRIKRRQIRRRKARQQRRRGIVAEIERNGRRRAIPRRRAVEVLGRIGVRRTRKRRRRRRTRTRTGKRANGTGNATGAGAEAAGDPLVAVGRGPSARWAHWRGTGCACKRRSARLKRRRLGGGRSARSALRAARAAALAAALVPVARLLRPLRCRTGWQIWCRLWGQRGRQRCLPCKSRRLPMPSPSLRLPRPRRRTSRRSWRWGTLAAGQLAWGRQGRTTPSGSSAAPAVWTSGPKSPCVVCPCT
mmetsp:Transcript_63149/g.135591  ORF Transcript_63149/g.135591 Transcript_63149/m.135591 type:complete len:302 (-) Transcript_63149:326-1231(-)